MTDRAGAISPGRRFEAVTPDDDTDIAPTRAILIETSGPVAVIGENDVVSVTIPYLVAGIWHPMAVKRILDTGTTETTVYVLR